MGTGLGSGVRPTPLDVTTAGLRGISTGPLGLGAGPLGLSTGPLGLCVFSETLCLLIPLPRLVFPGREPPDADVALPESDPSRVVLPDVMGV